MQQSVLITGNSSGIGLGLTACYLDLGWSVYGLSRRGCRGLTGNLHDIHCDLGDIDSIAPALRKLLADVYRLDLVFLNAGVLGEIKEITKTSMEDIQHVMDINVWANKIILDELLQGNIRVDQVISISSGAAVNGNKGWSAYSLSKAALNMLTRLYAREYPHTHFNSLAPGLVDTAMQDYLCDEHKLSIENFPTLEKIRNARKTGQMPDPATAAKKIANIVADLKRYESGDFVDIRTL